MKQRDNDNIDTLFDRLDTWRHLPNYQLERRADIFFALYIAEALEAKLGFAIYPRLIPEFPVRIGTIYPDIPIDRSYKIDYVAVSRTLDRVVFVELKTEGLSRRPQQDKYLLATREAGMPALLDGLLQIFRATNAKRKYYRLLEHLAAIGLLDIPAEFRAIMERPHLQGANEASRSIKVKAPTQKPIIIFIQPRGEDGGVINFRTFADIVGKHNDPISQRFALSLNAWAAQPAGESPIPPAYGPAP